MSLQVVSSLRTDSSVRRDKHRGSWYFALSTATNEPVRLTAHKSVSRGTVHRRLMEKCSQAAQGHVWVDADYVAPMEDVLDFYAEAPIRRKPNPPHRRGAPTLRLRVSAAAPRICSCSWT